MKMIPAFRATGVAAALLITGCAGPGYFVQAAGGQMSVLNARRPIAEVLNDAAAPAAVRTRLELVQRARDFAARELKLDAHGSFATYADLGRPYAVWNVIATPEFSLTPKRWCFPIAGCIGYRGYFEQRKAEKYAAQLRRKGLDVHVGGAAAYSTLGWFRDPVLSSTLRYDDAQAVAVVFHELAHARLYLRGDTTFNESFATAVEEQGMHRFLAGADGATLLAAWQTSRAREQGFHELLGNTRTRLAALYAGDLDEHAMRAEKSRTLDEARAAHTQLKLSWGEYAGYDRFFDAGLNNARLAAVAFYRQDVAAFTQLIVESGSDMQVFYQRARALSRLDPAARRVALDALAERAQAAKKSAAAPTKLSAGAAAD